MGFELSPDAQYGTNGHHVHCMHQLKAPNVLACRALAACKAALPAAALSRRRATQKPTPKTNAPPDTRGTPEEADRAAERLLQVNSQQTRHA